MMDLIMPRCRKLKSTKKNINRAPLHHNYSFRNLEKYKSLRSKGGAREELSRGGTLSHHRERLLPLQGIKVTFMCNFLSIVILIMCFSS
jgi:hypothetical protein